LRRETLPKTYRKGLLLYPGKKILSLQLLGKKVVKEKRGKKGETKEEERAYLP